MSLEAGDFLKFVEGPPSKSGRTKTWWVVQKQNDIHLGWIGWWGSWRRYAFYPKADTVYEEKCLAQIAEFIIAKTKEHRARIKVRIKSEVPVTVSWKPDSTDSRITHVHIYKKPKHGRTT